MTDDTSGVDRERSTTEIPGVSRSVFFRAKRAHSGFYGNEPLLWGERREKGWGAFFNREGIVSAWASRRDGAFRFSVEVTLDRSSVLTGRPGFLVHLWCWRYHAAMHIGPRGAGAMEMSTKQYRRARRDGVVDRSRSTP